MNEIMDGPIAGIDPKRAITVDPTLISTHSIHPKCNLGAVKQDVALQSNHERRCIAFSTSQLTT